MDEQLNSERAPIEHPSQLNSYRVPRTKFDEAIHALTEVPYKLARDGRRQLMIAALDKQATWGQIKHWRAGRRKVPEWVKQKLKEKLAARAHRAASGIDAAEAA